MPPRFPAPRRPALLLLLLAPAAFAAPSPDLLREEAYNYRIVGELPRGWKRRGDDLAFVFSVEEIPHAYVHLLRERLAGAVDVEARLKQRAPHYRFPGAGQGTETIRPSKWAGMDAFHLEHEAKLNGVNCRRRVEVLVVRGVWYERIETVYGEATDDLPRCRKGLDVFRQGFKILVEPLTAEAKADLDEAVIESAEYGYRIKKPKGFLRKEVDLVADPGLRVAFEARPASGMVLVRLFEYGVRDDLDAKAWLDLFYLGFSGYVTNPRRAPADAPKVKGAAETSAELFLGDKDGKPVQELVVLVRAPDGRTLCLRLRSPTPPPDVDLEVNG